MTKCQILKFPVQRTRLHILKRYNLRRAIITSPTLSIVFPSQLQIFPCSSVRQAFFMSGKAGYHFSLQSHTNRRLGHSAWQPITKSHLTSLATEQTVWWTAKGEGCRLSRGPVMDILHHDALEGSLKKHWMMLWEGK